MANFVRVMKDNSMNKGPAFEPLIANYGRTAVGESLLSIATSLSGRCASGSYASREGTVNSPHLKNPKKARQQATQNRIVVFILCII